jgi:DNA-binding transcriptional ArsR family regulator
MSQHNGDIDQRLVKALAHPLRLQILQILGGQVASPAQMADLTEQPVGNVAYHTNVLLEYGCIELVEEKPRRGAVEHFYRAKPHATVDSRSWQDAPEPLRRELVAASLDSFLIRATAAFEAKTFQTRKGSAFTWQPFTVDESGWKEVLRILKEGEERIRRIGEESAKRIESPQQGISIVVAFSAFETRGAKGQPSQ